MLIGFALSVAAAVATAAVAVVVTIAVVVVTTVMVAATATAVMYGMQLGFGSGTDGQHFATEAYIASCQGVVEVHRNFVAADIEDASHNAETVLGHHRNGGADFDGLAVELAVDYEDFALEVKDFFFVISAESFVAGDCHVERVAGLLAFEFLFQGFEDAFGDSVDDSLGVIGICLVYCHFRAVGCYLVKVVAQLDIHSGGDFCIFVVLHCVLDVS